MSPLDAAKQAIADTDVLYCQAELRSILANLVDYTEGLIERPKVRVTGLGFDLPNAQLDYSYYEHKL